MSTTLETLTPEAASHSQARRDCMYELTRRAHEADLRLDLDAGREIAAEALALAAPEVWTAYRLGHAQGALLVASIRIDRLEGELAFWKQQLAEETERLKADVEYWKTLALGKAGTR